MANPITLSPAEVADIFRALNGTRELLKALRVEPEKDALAYAIASNLAAIEMTLSGLPRATSN